MLFNSIEFLLFLPTVVALYFALPVRHRWALLLAASFYFYAAWKLEYLVLIIFSILVDYFAGLRMAGKDERWERRPYLVMSLVANLGLLIGFKYFNFFSDSLRAALEPFNVMADMPHLEFLLPVGISFYTFQSMSYTIDLYRGERGPERHLGIFALYVSFFPQLVAGPIERSTRLLPQFHEPKRFEYDRATSGLRLILWGFFKKIVIADQLALFVDQVYGAPGDWHGAAILLASYFFAFQIFCDFSAYTDIARGSARIMGYDLMENFNRPYYARSIRDFWARWHISLSTWFRDYLYIPLGGNRVVKWRWYYNLMVVFVVSGLWHGANWTFVAWGFLHGAYMVISLMTSDWRDRAWAALGRLAGGARQHAAVRATAREPVAALAGAAAGTGPGSGAGASAGASPGADAMSSDDEEPVVPDGGRGGGGARGEVGPGGPESRKSNPDVRNPNPEARGAGAGPDRPPTFAEDVARRADGWPERWRGMVDGLPVREAVALLFTFHLVVFSWIFFRADSISDAFLLIGNLGDWSAGVRQLAAGFEKFTFAPAILGVVILEAVHTLQERGGRSAVTRKLLGLPAWARWAIYYAVIMYMVLFGQYETAQQFIYFQF